MTEAKQPRTSDRVAKVLGLLLGLVGLPLLVAAVVFWPTREPYWTHQARIYDSLRNEYRCVDPDTGELSAIKSPCWVLTMRGLEAVKQRIAKCVERGGAQETCTADAWEWIEAQGPRTQ